MESCNSKKIPEILDYFKFDLPETNRNCLFGGHNIQVFNLEEINTYLRAPDYGLEPFIHCLALKIEITFVKSIYFVKLKRALKMKLVKYKSM